MTVGDLIKELSCYDPDMNILCSDRDGWWYELDKIREILVEDGVEIEPFEMDVLDGTSRVVGLEVE